MFWVSHCSCGVLIHCVFSSLMSFAHKNARNAAVARRDASNGKQISAWRCSQSFFFMSLVYHIHIRIKAFKPETSAAWWLHFLPTCWGASINKFHGLFWSVYDYVWTCLDILSPCKADTPWLRSACSARGARGGQLRSGFCSFIAPRDHESEAVKTATRHPRAAGYTSRPQNEQRALTRCIRLNSREIRCHAVDHGQGSLLLCDSFLWNWLQVPSIPMLKPSLNS